MWRFTVLVSMNIRSAIRGFEAFGDEGDDVVFGGCSSRGRGVAVRRASVGRGRPGGTGEAPLLAGVVASHRGRT
jgi:hypothetical protein